MSYKVLTKYFDTFEDVIKYVRDEHNLDYEIKKYELEDAEDENDKKIICFIFEKIIIRNKIFEIKSDLIKAKEEIPFDPFINEMLYSFEKMSKYFEL